MAVSFILLNACVSFGGCCCYTINTINYYNKQPAHIRLAFVSSFDEEDALIPLGHQSFESLIYGGCVKRWKAIGVGRTGG